VGFRPFVYRLAHRLGLSGWVRNRMGQVEIIAEGDATELAELGRALTEEGPTIGRPVCGPRLRFIARGQAPVDETHAALAHCVAAREAGRIVAVKGIGGYHLMCDALNEAAISRLRAKTAPHKPLAVMFRTLAGLEREAALGAGEMAFLESPMRPILLVHKHPDTALPGECPDRDGDWLAFTWDATGFGPDGTIWGGETLLGRPGAWRRVASLRPFFVPGGDKAGRDPTRGGIAAVAHEITGATGSGLRLTQAAIPVRDTVQSVGEMLGYDPYYLACAGRVVAVIAPDQQDRALARWHALPPREQAAPIGRITEDLAGVVLKTDIGGERLLEELEDDPLPRIC
jgi:hydrogenase maturation factor HypF (carbamoyltransferase family)